MALPNGWRMRAPNDWFAGMGTVQPAGMFLERVAQGDRHCEEKRVEPWVVETLEQLDVSVVSFITIMLYC